mgnify:CR=1 FL=1
MGQLKIIFFLPHLKCLPTTPTDCNLLISSSRYHGGTILSPSYPLAYPPTTVCRYEFKATANERIQLTFIDFSLAGNDTECYYADTVEVRQMRSEIQLISNLITDFHVAARQI